MQFSIGGFQAPNKILEMRIYRNGVLVPDNKGATRIISANGTYTMLTSIQKENTAINDTFEFRWFRNGTATGNANISGITHKFVYTTGTTTGGATLTGELSSYFSYLDAYVSGKE